MNIYVSIYSNKKFANTIINEKQKRKTWFFSQKWENFVKFNIDLIKKYKVKLIKKFNMKI